jgi:hypothetical protein
LDGRTFLTNRFLTTTCPEEGFSSLLCFRLVFFLVLPPFLSSKLELMLARLGLI